MGNISVLRTDTSAFSAFYTYRKLTAFNQKKKVIILCDSWYDKHRRKLSFQDDFTLSDEKIDDYYMAVRRVFIESYYSRIAT
ncbi:MAG: hypothetical protein K2I96_08415 [Lachnospiraceae bacterium]|nr:hypothetical protein [Lachnospiraceae bacterium]